MANEREPAKKVNLAEKRANDHTINNITGDPETDGAGNLEPEKRNELALSELELDAGLGRGPFERPTPIEEAGTNHPNYLPTSDQSEEER